MFEDTYKTIKSRSEGIYKEKGSKFIAIALPVCTEVEVKEQLALLRKEYFDARHHCYAYILGFDKSAYRINDDGEPSGTAGRPIHGQLLSKDLTNTLVVVVEDVMGVVTPATPMRTSSILPTTIYKFSLATGGGRNPLAR